MTTAPTILGIDLGKNWFHLVGLDERGATVLRKRLNRRQLSAFAATAPRTIVATEACPGSQYWGRVFAQAGHEVRILPAHFVKPYVQANKNDFHDAAAIAEAGNRARMRCVPLKTSEQIELQALHRLRQRAVRERTAMSRPRELHPQPLVERYVNLSAHTAPIRRTHLSSRSASAQTVQGEPWPSVPSTVPLWSSSRESARICA